ncbi:hypothetical protein JW921_11395 [Candidatus Fermentibacterales bacterium]|nr:hypothetical protein [Candidatus Fermentibacterales bacterium]
MRPAAGERPLGPLCAFSGGLLTAVAQSTILREGLSGYRAAELASGMVLAGWLVFSGLGAWMGQLLRGSRRRLWAVVTVAMAPACLCWLILARAVAVPAILYAAFPGLLAGLIFILPFRGSSATGLLYGLESFGAAGGGALFLLLSGRLLPPGLLLVCGALSGLALAPVLRWRALVASSVFVALLASGLHSGLWETVLGATSYRSFDSVRAAPSPYGELVTASREGEVSAFRAGLLLGTTGSPEAAEAISVVPLIAAEGRGEVLYAGSNPETAALISEWPGTGELTVVTIDTAPFEALSGRSGNHGRFSIVEQDPRRFIASCSTGKWDLVILELGPPLSIYDNRFYTQEFFRHLRESMSLEGLAALALPAGQNRVHPVEARMISSIQRAAEPFFSVAALPISGALLLLGTDPDAGLDSLDGESLAALLRGSRATTRYVTEGLLPFDLSTGRIESMRSQLAQAADAPPNRDLTPEAFILATGAWALRGGSHDRSRELELALGALLVLFCLAVMLARPRTISIAVGSMGIGEISVEVTCLVLVQATLGYSFVMVGAVVGLFMAGLGVGSILSVRLRASRLAVIQVLGACLLLLLAALCTLYDTGALGERAIAAGSLAILLCMGLVGGAQFPLAVRASGGTRAVGPLEATDLLGSALGAVGVAVFAFPLLGAGSTCLAIGGLVLVSAVLPALEARKERREGRSGAPVAQPLL